MDVNRWYNSTLELLERGHRLQEFTSEWLNNPKYGVNLPLFTTQAESTIIEFIMEPLWPFRYWTLKNLKWHMVTPLHIITVYNDMFNYMDGIMQALAKENNEWKEDWYFAVWIAHQKLSEYFTEVTSTTGVLPNSADIVDPFQKKRSFSKWAKGIDITAEDETSYTTEHQDVFLKYVVYEYCAKHSRLPMINPESVPSNNIFCSTMASRTGQSSYDLYDLPSIDKEYLMGENLGETTPRRSNHAACALAATRLYSNSPYGIPQTWGQLNRNHNNYHSGSAEIRSTFWIPDFTGWRYQQEESHSQYADLTNVACDIFWNIPHGVRVKASVSLGRDVIGCGRSKTTGVTFRKKVLVRQFTWPNNGILAGDDPESAKTITDNNLDMKWEAEQMTSHRMAMVNNHLEM